MAFEPYTKPLDRGRPAPGLTLTLRPDGEFHLNTGACAALGLSREAKTVAVSFDKDGCSIALAGGGHARRLP